MRKASSGAKGEFQLAQHRIGHGPLDLKRSSRAVKYFVLMALGLAMSLFATRQGIGTSPDSVAYLGAARNVLAGRGLSLPFGDLVDSPLIQYPPLYPLTLAGAASIGGDVLEWARLVAALLFGANIIIVALLTAEEVPQARWLPIAAGVGFMFSPASARLHMMAWSEPLFLVCVGLGLWAVFRSRTTSTWWPLILAGLLFGGASLTRYAGLACTLTGCVALISDTNRSWRERLVRAGVLGGIAVAPITIWLVRNRWLFGDATGRMISFHPAGAADIWLALNTVADWLLIPQNWPRRPEMALLLIAGFAILFGVTRWRRRQEQEMSRAYIAYPTGMRQLLLLFVFCYGAFLLVSLSFVDANTQLDSRILSPILMAMIPVVASYAHQLLLGFDRVPVVNRAVGVFPALYLLLMAANTLGVVQTSSVEGIGFNQRRWRESALIARAAALPEDSVIYSNAPEPLYLLAGRRSVRLPKAYERVAERVNPEYQAEMRAMQASLASANGRVVYFHLASSSSTATLDELGQLVPLAIEFENDDGSILGLESGR